MPFTWTNRNHYEQLPDPLHAGRRPDPIRAAQARCDQGVRVIGLGSDRAAWLWLNHPQSTWHRVAVEGRKPEAISGAILRVEGFPRGPCEFEWWDTYSGKVVARGTTDVPGADGLQLAVPELLSDLALKVRAARRESP